MTASIIISTKNRKEDLLRAIRSALHQTSAPEIIILDDGSTDGTSEAILKEFPHQPRVRLFHYNESQGPSLRRNQGASMAIGEILFFIDDDAEFSTPHVVEQTLKDFNHPQIGAVAIPYKEPHKSNTIHQVSLDKEKIWITDTFIAAACATRKDLFLKLKGYREDIFYQGEESDYCLRMMNTGYYLRLGRSDPILHWESPKRSLDRMDYYGARNALLFHWWNTPALYLPLALPITAVRCASLSWVPHRLRIRLRGLFDAIGAFRLEDRHPVSIKSYRQWRMLRRKKAIPLPIQ
jgi:glycosyltransferase involved in cell wall biosynthesis